MIHLRVVVFSLIIFVGVFAESTFNVNNNERIVGGNVAAEGQFPYQISLRQLNQHVCGGSIISPNWILTAAHCVYRKLIPFTVVVGSNYLNAGGTTYLVRRIILHERYDSKTQEHDIALVRILGKITFNDKTTSISLSNSTLPAGVNCTLSGWGLTKYPSEILPQELQYIYLQSISVSKCESLLRGLSVKDSHVCTLEEKQKGACKGDSGGPLVCSGVQEGIVSWGIPCATGRPDVFTALSAYREWIFQKSGI